MFRFSRVLLFSVIGIFTLVGQSTGCKESEPFGSEHDSQSSSTFSDDEGAASLSSTNSENTSSESVSSTDEEEESDAESTTASDKTDETADTSESGSSSDTGDTIKPYWNHDILHVDLEVDVVRMRAQAKISVKPGEARLLSFEVGDLQNIEVLIENQFLQLIRREEILHVVLPDASPPETEAAAPLELVFRYEVLQHDAWDGIIGKGLTFLWPYYCGNLFPCKSNSSDGITYSVRLLGTGNQTVIVPEQIHSNAPSYMLAWAIGDYARIDRGTTNAGTNVAVWYLRGHEERAEKGTKSLLGYFEWLEKTLGGYMYGKQVASVQADWGPGGYGGMEHHPYWHVGSLSMDDPTIHAHEAAHGWYGNGIRIACWEDFVLSEGTVSYLTARIIEEVDGIEAGEAIWAGYLESLRKAQENSEIKQAWHDGCNDIDILSGYFSRIPYMKGAFFFRALERAIGRDKIDAALRMMYNDYAGRSARFENLLEKIEKVAKFDPRPCAEVWLKSDVLPDIDASCIEMNALN